MTPGFMGRVMGILLSVTSMLLLLAGEGATAADPAKTDQTELVGFLTDGGILTCRLVTLKLQASEKDQWLVVVFGPKDLAAKPDRELVLDGVTFGKPVTVGELLGEQPPSPHAQAAKKVKALCSAEAPTWNEFLSAVAGCIRQAKCSTLHGVAVAQKVGESTHISASRTLSADDVLAMKKKQ